MLKPYDLKQDHTFFESSCKIMFMLADEMKIPVEDRRNIEENVKKMQNRLFDFNRNLGYIDESFRFSGFNTENAVIKMYITKDFLVEFEIV